MQCDVTDLQGNHCPEEAVHTVVFKGVETHLCERCHANVLAGAYCRQRSFMKKHLRYDLWGANEEGEMRHAQLVMKELGITYQHATPQSISDQWWFWNCDNIPETLPSYITELNLDPMEQIGWGLSQENAKKIRDATQQNTHLTGLTWRCDACYRVNDESNKVCWFCETAPQDV